MAKKPRLIVGMENFHSTELDCSCGCGKKTHPKLGLLLQAFIYILEAIYGTSVKCIVHSGARCKAKHSSISDDETSFHMGLTRLDEGPGAAVDCHFEMLIAGKGLPKWVVIPKNEVAKHAITSKLFGGVGWKIYPKIWRMVHLDMGNVRIW